MNNETNLVKLMILENSYATLHLQPSPSASMEAELAEWKMLTLDSQLTHDRHLAINAFITHSFRK